ncbi:MAG: hypothetical protein OXC31_04595 [Spirochaetaceae bacterium]|nr:hypothetical protein [Spirochaetaceae bacterium]
MSSTTVPHLLANSPQRLFISARSIAADLTVALQRMNRPVTSMRKAARHGRRRLPLMSAPSIRLATSTAIATTSWSSLLLEDSPLVGCLRDPFFEIHRALRAGRSTVISRLEPLRSPSWTTFAVVVFGSAPSLFSQPRRP